MSGKADSVTDDLSQFKPGWDVFSENPMLSCECGWEWDGNWQTTTLADMVEAARQHLHEDGYADG